MKISIYMLLMLISLKANAVCDRFFPNDFETCQNNFYSDDDAMASCRIGYLNGYNSNNKSEVVCPGAIKNQQAYSIGFGHGQSDRRIKNETCQNK